MEISKADQIALDDALVAPPNRLKIGKCNLRLSSDVTSKEATLQVVYDVLKLTPFYKAFQVSADVPEIYMQEFWASTYIHNRSVRFKMNNKKHILNLDQFRDILQICPKVDAYTPYSDPRGFIYENKDKKNKLMRIDELHKFSDGTLDDVRTTLNDRLKGIRIEYLPQTFWIQHDKANARAMIQAIDKRLKTRRIMCSLERFVGGRQYGGDLRLLQRTI
ncbi:hypothetical protein Tco_1397511 [Tanacetum coccineum]